MAELAELRFRIEYRLTHSEEYRRADWSDGRHAAQFLAYVTVQNRNRQSHGHGDFLWFGVPMYDSRVRMPRGHAAQDTAGSKKFIYNPPASAYTTRSAHDGDWVSIDRDLVPLIYDGLKKAWDRGFLTESRDPADYRVGEFNIGWEMPGTLAVEMQVRNLAMDAVMQ